MRQRDVIPLFVLFTYLTALHGQERPFTVRDSNEMTIFNDPSQFAPGSTAKRSHDGRYAFVVTSRGSTTTDQIESTLWLYKLSALRELRESAPSDSLVVPKRLVAFSAVPQSQGMASYPSLIVDARWSSQSDAIYFRAQNRLGNHRLYCFDVSKNQSRSLTPANRDVLSFDIAKDGTVIFRMSVPYDRTDGGRPGDRINKDAWDVTGLNLESILFPGATQNELRPFVTELWTAKYEASQFLSKKLAEGSEYDLNVIDLLSISPSARWAINLRPVTSVPASWAQYQPSKEYKYMRIDPRDARITSPFDDFRLKQYQLIDLREGRSKMTIAAPQADPMGYGPLEAAVWSPDERRLLLLNTYLPLPEGHDGGSVRSTSPCAVVVVELSSKQDECIAFEDSAEARSTGVPMQLEGASFGNNSDEVTVSFRSGMSHASKSFHFIGGGWFPNGPAPGSRTIARDLTKSTPDVSDDLELSVEQSWNNPPVLWTRNSRTNARRALWNPNSQLEQVKLAEAQLYRWTSVDGHPWRGALIKPVGFVYGKRYPLVIQTHGFREDQFMMATEGAFPTSMAARALASAGIMVLQLPSRHDGEGSPDEANANVDGFLDAIHQMVADGLVDPARVGIVGFSRTAWYVETALIHYPKLFAAAVIADGIDQSYIQYHLMSENPVHAAAIEPMYHTQPVGEGLKVWMTSAPGFNLNKIETPLKIESIGPMSLLLEWEIYSSLREQRKPVDMEYIPDGCHILQRPLDKLASQEGTVDWFRFWLDEYVDPSPRKIAQYQRWKELQRLERDSVAPRL